MGMGPRGSVLEAYPNAPAANRLVDTPAEHAHRTAPHATLGAVGHRKIVRMGHPTVSFGVAARVESPLRQQVPTDRLG
jgi:hypothetical protein